MDDDIVDSKCDPKNPQVVIFDHITTAEFLIMDGVAKTPCTRATNAGAYNMDLYFKKEFMQATGSFKERGARCALIRLSDEQKQIGVISASTGNHALAISYHGNQLNIPVTVVVPTSTSLSTIEKCHSYNATVLTEGRDIEACKIIALVLAKDRGLEYINCSDHPNVIAGSGTIGLEILNQVPKVEAVVVQIGGGGLIAGIAKAIKTLSPKTKIIGVELEKCPSFMRAIENQGPTYTPPDSSLAESLLVPTVGCNSFPIATGLIDKLIMVREVWIALAMLRLLDEEECVIEGAGAVGLAAILSGQLSELDMKRTVVLLTGCNTNPASFGRALERGLAAELRLLHIDCETGDYARGIRVLFEKLFKFGFSVKEVLSECVWLKSAYLREVDQLESSPLRLSSIPNLKVHTLLQPSGKEEEMPEVDNQSTSHAQV